MKLWGYIMVNQNRCSACPCVTLNVEGKVDINQNITEAGKPAILIRTMGDGQLFLKKNSFLIWKQGRPP